MCLTLQGQPQWTLVPIDMAYMPRVMFPFLCPSLRMVLTTHSPPGINPVLEVPFCSLSSPRVQAEAFLAHSQSWSLCACSRGCCLGPIFIGRGVSGP